MAFRALLLIDITVSRDIEPELNCVSNVYLYNIDDLQAIADDYLRQRLEEIARCESVICKKARANAILTQCRTAFPRLKFEIKIIKTTGDKFQTASLAKEGENLPKGLSTKELEVALLKHQADLAVHSLKDLPTELPAGLTLGAVGERAEFDATILAVAGLERLNFNIASTGKISGEPSAQVRERVIAARKRQHQRFADKPKISCNARMSSRELKAYCAVDGATVDLLKFAMADLNLSARAYDRILKVARTIADLAGSENIIGDHVSEAIQYRSLDRRLWT
jgi:hypothetical protein